MSKILSGEELCHVEGQDNNKPCAATPPESLRQHLMDPNVPKSELEWYAARKLKEAERANEALRERVEKLERVAEAAKKVTPYIPEVGETTVCYKSLTDETNVVTQEVQDIIWGLTNDYDDARAALESDHE